MISNYFMNHVKLFSFLLNRNIFKPSSLCNQNIFETPYLAIRPGDSQVLNAELVDAVADGVDGDLTQELDAGLLVVSTTQVDRDGAFDAIVVLVAVEESCC